MAIERPISLPIATVKIFPLSAAFVSWNSHDWLHKVAPILGARQKLSEKRCTRKQLILQASVS
jgi:hypothetical protein